MGWPFISWYSTRSVARRESDWSCRTALIQASYATMARSSGATLRGNVSTAHASVAAGSAPESAAARSLTSTGLSIGSAAQVAQLEQAIDHPDRARGHVVTLRVDHQLRRERLLVGVRNAGELGDLARQRAGVQALGVAAHT